MIFGEGQDDDIVGGYGNDWISGGTGDDGVIGDDGRISTSRNSPPATRGTTRPATWVQTLHRQRRRHLPRRAAERRRGAARDRSGHAQTRTATCSTSSSTRRARSRPRRSTSRGALNKSVNLTPFNVDPTRPDRCSTPNGYDDIIFGGLGNDFLHGGSGDDAIVGRRGAADRRTSSSTRTTRRAARRTTTASSASCCSTTRTRGTSATRSTSAPTRTRGTRTATSPTASASSCSTTSTTRGARSCSTRTGRRGAASRPRRAATPAPTPAALRRPRASSSSTGDANERPRRQSTAASRRRRAAARASRPRTRTATATTSIFGDLGNDWLVGGTGNDTLWGGFGNDLMNADDDLSTGCIHDGQRRQVRICRSDTWLNDAPDTHPTYEDRVYGGAGLDILIGNTGGDRLIDWVGEFNSYIVPFAPFGIATVSRQVPPALCRVPVRALEGAGRRPDPRSRRGRFGRRGAERRAEGRDRPRHAEGSRPLAAADRQPDRPAGRQHPGRPPRRPAHAPNFNDGTTDRLRARQRRLDGRPAATLQVVGGVARPGRGRRLLRRPDPADLLRAPRLGADPEADGRLERERLRDLRLLLADRLQVRRASTSASTRSSSATGRRRAGSSTRPASSPAASRPTPTTTSASS